MSNDLVLPTDLSQFDADVAKALGLKSGFEGTVDTLPSLRINTAFDDDDGNTLTPGTFHASVPYEKEDGTFGRKEYFAKTAQIRIFANMFQIQHYNPDAKDDKDKFVNKTILVPDMGNHEMVDELGGTRCGKIRAKDREGRSVEELERDKKTKQSYRFLYGKVKMDGAVNRQQEAQDLDWTPFRMRLRGTNFMGAGELLESIEKQGKMAYNVPVTISLERKKNGDVVYYEVKYEPDMVNLVPAIAEDGELLRKFYETIQAENQEVWKKHKAALKGTRTDEDQVAQDLMSDLEAEANSDLGSDLDDEIPF